jgi:hypothetical protein
MRVGEATNQQRVEKYIQETMDAALWEGKIAHSKMIPHFNGEEGRFHPSYIHLQLKPMPYRSVTARKVLEDLVDTLVAIDWIQDKNILRGSIHTENIVLKTKAIDYAPM